MQNKEKNLELQLSAKIPEGCPGVKTLLGGAELRVPSYPTPKNTHVLHTLIMHGAIVHNVPTLHPRTLCRYVNTYRLTTSVMFFPRARVLNFFACAV